MSEETRIKRFEDPQVAGHDLRITGRLFKMVVDVVVVVFLSTLLDIESAFKVSTIMWGVLLGNLLTGIVGVVAYAIVARA